VPPSGSASAVRRWTVVPLLAALLALTACQPSPPVPRLQSETAQTVMLRVGKQVQACWFKTKDPTFRNYRMADELNSYTGKPRLLIVPRKNPGGLPKLVAEAQKRGGRVQFAAYGPLIDSKDGPRLHTDLRKWASGRTTC